MVWESEVKLFSVFNAENGASLLPAVSGKSYRIKNVIISAYNTVASTGGSVGIAATDRFGVAASVASLRMLPGVVNNNHIVVPGIDFVTKPGTIVWLGLKDELAQAAKTAADFGMTQIQIQYTEIDE